ncbi:ATP-binding protein [Streptomyces sp. NPDC051776]|uniref:sensor histidine kinase n=1 Tax=Streptomyces sp. NPDC051776 TaxID=3155414 RepID=UPI00344315C1
MRRRPGRPTIRTRIVTLTLIPIAALLALWAAAMVSLTGDARALMRLQGVYEHFGTPVDTAVGQIQTERRLAAAYVASPRGVARTALVRQHRATDLAVRGMRAAASGEERQDELTGRQRAALRAMVDAAGRLPSLRDQVLTRRISWSRAIDRYSALVEPTFAVRSALTAHQAEQSAREAQTVVELVRVREFVSREDALVAGARAAGSFGAAQYRALVATIEDRRVFQRTYVPDLPEDSRTLFEEFRHGRTYERLATGEDALLAAGARGAGKAVTADSWRTTMEAAVRRYTMLCTEAAENSAEHRHAFATGELIRTGTVGGLGLLAVAGSVLISVRAGRRISARLEDLRDSADLATRQLPGLIRKLSHGGGVEPPEVAPLPDEGCAGAQDEIGQVSRALGTAHRAAVEAAVEQAGLRRGVHAVLLNIARRNQALIHRQLKLVDTLERRTADPDVLEDLFRIDHLTTRMRRHAEGLIILSGSAPGRRRRKPVPVVDVVGSAVGEIEEYARVDVPPMPAVGVKGEAVADVVHLIAELVENATVFSPPHTPVTMRLERNRRGCVLQIDDRGLGMDPAALDEANRTLAREGDFDPAQTERLGLYVVGRLAGRHRIDVSLTRSPYGGTTAVVVLPAAILEDLPEIAIMNVEETAEAAATADPDSPTFAVPVSVAAGPVASVAPTGAFDGADDFDGPEAFGGSDAFDGRDVFDGPGGSGGPGGLVGPGGPGGPVGPGGPGGPGDPDGPAVLPRRVRQTHLAPQLRAVGPPGAGAGGPSSGVPGSSAGRTSGRTSGTTSGRTSGTTSGRTSGRTSGTTSGGTPGRTPGRTSGGMSGKGRPSPAAEGHEPDGAGREVAPERMRVIFGAFQRGVERGRDSEPGEQQGTSASRSNTTEGADDDTRRPGH